MGSKASEFHKSLVSIDSHTAKKSASQSEATNSSLCLTSLAKPHNDKVKKPAVMKLQYAKLDTSLETKAQAKSILPADKSASEKKPFVYESDTDYLDDPPKRKPERLWASWIPRWEAKAKSAEKTCIEFVKEIYNIPKIGSLADAKEICKHLPDSNHKVSKGTLNWITNKLEEGRLLVASGTSGERCGIKELASNIQCFYLPDMVVKICDDANIPLPEYLAQAQENSEQSESSLRRLKTLVKRSDLSPTSLQEIAKQAVATADSIHKIRNNLVQLQHPLIQKYEDSERYGTRLDLYEPVELVSLRSQKQLIERYRQVHGMCTNIGELVTTLIKSTDETAPTNSDSISFSTTLDDLSRQANVLSNYDIYYLSPMEVQNIGIDTIESLILFRQGANKLQKIMQQADLNRLRTQPPAVQHKFFTQLQSEIFDTKDILYKGKLYSINDCSNQLVDQYNQVNDALNKKRTGSP